MANFIYIDFTKYIYSSLDQVKTGDVIANQWKFFIFFIWTKFVLGSFSINKQYLHILISSKLYNLRDLPNG